MHCLILTMNTSRNGRKAETMQAAIAGLDAFGITYRRRALQELSSAAIADLHNNYDFVFVPYATSGMAAFYNDATMQLPVIGLDSDTQSTGFGNNGGVTGAKGSVADVFVTGDFATNPYVALRGYTGHSLTVDGTAIATIAATDTISGAPQTNAGNVVLWSGDLAGGKKCYLSACLGDISPVFPILLQTAINDGQITATVPKKAPIVCDLDHINGEQVRLDPTTLDYIESQIAGGMMWGGIQNDSATRFENMEAQVQAKLLEHQAKGTFKFCYHSHRDNGGEQKTTGTWPYPSSGGTLASQITQAAELAIYDQDEATWNGFGLRFNYPAHYNAGANAWDDETLETFAAKGFVSARMGSGRHCSRVGPQPLFMFSNAYKTKRTYKGIRLFLFHDMDGAWSSLANCRNQYRYILQSVVYGFGMYLHDDDFDQTNQEPEAGAVGSTVTQCIRDLAGYCNNLTVPFADITKFV